MTRLLRYGPVALLLLFCGGCATPRPYNPFKVSRQEIFSRVKTVAVAALELPDELPQADQTRAEFETMVAEQLKAMGFQVVPAGEYDQIFKRMREEVGGFYDPQTGKADTEKIKKVRDLCRRELAAKFHADAVLYPAITVVSARFAGGRAGWDGVTESATPEGFFQRLFAGEYQGTMPALSLWVVLQDINGESLYVNGGGLQLVSKITAGGRFVSVPVTELLVDPAIKTRSVQIAFAPLRGEPVERKRPRSPELK